MNEQTKRKPMGNSSKALNIEVGVQDMIARLMTLARLLVMPSVIEDPLGTNQARNRYKKHRTENL